MKFNEQIPPRKFTVGYDKKGVLRDCGSIYLEADEQITFFTPSGGEYDVTKKDWGFYATPSINERLASFKLRVVITKNRFDKYFIMIVEEGKEAEFQKYVEEEPLQIITWLSNVENLKKLDYILNGK